MLAKGFDPLEIAFKLLIEEEKARLSQGRVEKREEPARLESGRIHDASTPVTLIDVSGRGVLRELVVKASSPSFKATVIVDGEVLYSEDYTWFQSVSDTLESIDAFTTDSTYVLRFQGVGFNTGIRVSVDGLEPGFTISEAYWVVEYSPR